MLMLVTSVIHVNRNGNIPFMEKFWTVNDNRKRNWKILKNWNKTKTKKMKTVTENYESAMCSVYFSQYDNTQYASNIERVFSA